MGTEGEKPADKPADAPKKGTSAFAKKMLKVMTIMAYISGVSGPGFLLSLYYIIFFEPGIQGVRPPGYLKSGEMVGLPQAQALVDPMPQSLVNTPPVYDKKMSREFMEAYFRNLTAGKGGDTIASAEQSNIVEPAEPTPMALPIFQETRNHHLNSHHSHHSGQTAQSNNNHQSSGPSPQQGGMARDTSSPEVPFMPEESRQHHHQQQHGQPPLSASA